VDCQHSMRIGKVEPERLRRTQEDRSKDRPLQYAQTNLLLRLRNEEAYIHRCRTFSGGMMLKFPVSET
jgi:hypothetical protein